MDFSYIASQTFGDVELERELLGLFASQARRLLLDLPHQDPHGQRETAHLLKGSALAVGATRVAIAADLYESLVPSGQPVRQADDLDGFQAGDPGDRLDSGLTAVRPTDMRPPEMRPAALRSAATAFEDRAHAFRDLASAIEAAATAIAQHLTAVETRPI